MKTWQQMRKEFTFRDWLKRKCTIKELIFGSKEMKSRMGDSQKYWGKRIGTKNLIIFLYAICAWIVMLIFATPAGENLLINPLVILGLFFIALILVINILNLRVEIYELKVLGIGLQKSKREIEEE